MPSVHKQRTHLCQINVPLGNSVTELSDLLFFFFVQLSLQPLWVLETSWELPARPFHVFPVETPFTGFVG